MSFLKKSLKWYYDYEIKENSGKISSLQFRKKSILSEVQEKVTYLDAKNILEEYSPAKVKNQVRSVLQFK